MPTEERLLRDLFGDGFEHLGTIALGRSIVVGDPAFLADARVWKGDVEPGRWHVLGRPDALDPDLLAEIVIVHTDALPLFYDAYDAAVPEAETALASDRVALLDGHRRAEPDLPATLLEPEELPWVLDDGLVVAAPDRAWVYRAGRHMVSITFGEGPAGIAAAGHAEG